MYRGDDGGRVHVMVTAFVKLSRMVVKGGGWKGKCGGKGVYFLR